MSEKLIRKLATRTITGLTVAGIREHAEKVPNKPLYTIVGIATGTKSGESDKGPWTALIGNFVAINFKGERFRAGSLFLEKAAMDLILGALAGGAEGVEFGFNIYVKADSEAATGYVYHAESLVAPSSEDPVEKLLGSIDKKKLAALPAPAAPENRAENEAENKAKK